MASLSQIAVSARHSGSPGGAAQRANQRRDLIVMVVLAVFMAALIGAYLLTDLSGNIDYVLGLGLRAGCDCDRHFDRNLSDHHR